MNLETKIKENNIIIEDKLKNYIKGEFPSILYEAMDYSVFAGGKRLRPLLVLASCESLCGNAEKSLPFACAIELIHTYSLIHDDLPAMDDDDFRRGKPSNHKKFGEAMAILAGDALLNMAYEIMSDACIENPHISHITAMNILAKASGTKGMVGGQAVDIDSENKIIDKDTLIYIHENKTAALIQASICAGAVVGGATEEELFALKKVGISLGIAFQIKDDILDVIGTSEILGKPVGSDDKKNKQTYVSLFGLSKSEEDYKYHSQKAIELLKALNFKSDFLVSLCKKIIAREK